MTTVVDKSIEISVPVREAYDQWTQFESFPRFMSGLREVTQLDETTLHWVAEIAGVRREWDATILEQVPDQKVAWAAISGATNTGAVYFSSTGPDRTLVRLVLEFEPEGLVETLGDKLDVVERQVEGDLERFKDFIEAHGAATGGWRGTVEGNVGTPDASVATSHGDSGKAGISGKVVAAGAAAAAAGAVGVAAVARSVRGGNDTDETATTVHAKVVEEDFVLGDASVARPAPTDDAIALETTKETDG